MKPLIIQFLFLFTPFFVFAQAQTIRGIVADQESRMPIIGAAVVVVGSDPIIGTTTDLDGKFHLPKVKVGRVDLKITYLGYASMQMTGFSIPWGSSERRKALRYERL